MIRGDVGGGHPLSTSRLSVDRRTPRCALPVGRGFAPSFGAHGMQSSRPSVRHSRTVLTCLHHVSSSCRTAARSQGAASSRSRASWRGSRTRLLLDVVAHAVPGESGLAADVEDTESAFEQSEAPVKIKWNVGSAEHSSSEAGEPARPHAVHRQVCRHPAAGEFVRGDRAAGAHSAVEVVWSTHLRRRLATICTHMINKSFRRVTVCHDALGEGRAPTWSQRRQSQRRRERAEVS